jgi:hypothetical protein
MKSSLNPNSIAALAALIVTAAVAVPTSANARDLRIHGSLETTESQVLTPPTLLVQLEGIGNASHLGRFVLDTEAVIFLPTASGEGEFEISTGSGATLFGLLAGQAFPDPDSDLVPVVETLTITGGTGRFSGATGTLTVDRVASRSTGVSTGTIEGIVTLP